MRAAYKDRISDSSVKFINGYNPSHLAGAGDITQAAAQTLNSSVSTFDRDTILLKIHPQVTTRKLLLVGHSQGSFYSNALYDYLLAHGEPKAAVGVYQVGTPASSVSGGGKYVTSSNDAVINAARLIASNATNGLAPLGALGTAPKTKPPLPANITLSNTDYGHGFSNVYLAEAPERIVGDMQSTLKNLKAESATETGECFTAPDSGLGYQAAKAGFAVADAAAAGVKAGAGVAQVAAVAAGNVLASVAQGAYGVVTKVAGDIGITAGGVAGLSKASETKSRPTNFDIFSKLYGSSVSKEEYKELLGSSVAFAPVFNSAPAQTEETEDVSDSPAPKKIIYLSGSHRRSGGGESQDDVEIQTEVVEPVVTPEVVPPTEPEPDPIAEPEPDPIPPIESAPILVPALSPVTDSFDSYDGSGWTTYGGSNNFGPRPGVIKYFATSSEECHANGCLSGSIETGNGGWGNPIRMYKTGTAVSEGSLVIWKKYHHGQQGVSNVWVQVCVGAPDEGNRCDGLISGSISGEPDVWTQYYLAWRNTGDIKELCTLTNDTDQSHCTWQPTSVFAAGDAPDTVVISGDAVRPDLGDRLWFDNLGTP